MELSYELIFSIKYNCIDIENEKFICEAFCTYENKFQRE